MLKNFEAFSHLKTTLMGCYLNLKMGEVFKQFNGFFLLMNNFASPIKTVNNGSRIFYV